MAAWEFPVLVMQGRDDPKQPREWYEGVERHMPDARATFIDAGLFFVFENPEQTTAILRDFLASPPG
jgi:pimeloyl-ACP methyl ester carboxylesterase